ACPTTVRPLEDGFTQVWTSRPSEPSSCSAALRFIPTTLGIGNDCGPFDTTIVTVEPFGARPFAGCWRITSPRGTVSENRSTCSTTNPADRRAAVALSAERPVRAGTFTGCGPALTTRCTALP